MQYHPDSSITATATLEQQQSEDDDISAKFWQVRLTYDALCSGIRVTDSSSTTSSASWCESLGGRDWIDFFHIPPLISAGQAKKEMEETVKSAVIGLDSDTVMAFVTRNLAAPVAGSTKSNKKWKLFYRRNLFSRFSRVWYRNQKTVGMPRNNYNDNCHSDSYVCAVQALFL